MKGKEKLASRVTLRSIVLGALLIPLDVFWVTLIEVKYYSLDGSCLPLFVQPVFFLFVVTVLNRFVARMAPRVALKPHELLVIYVMNAVSVTFSGHDTFQNMFGAIAHAYWYATSENEWADLFLRHLPSWLTVSDPKALKGFYEGESSLYVWENVRPWVLPFLAWLGFMLVLMFMMLCLNTFLRRRWTEQEKLAYPNIQLPVRLTDDAGRLLFRNRMFWIGFGMASFVTVVNGIHFWVPQFPFFKYVKQENIGAYFTEKPWNALNGMTISMYPFFIGLTFFMPLDLSFSCWFFYLFRRAQQVLGVAVGFRSLPEFPYFGQQGWGAWLTLCGLAIWTSRRQLGTVWRGVFRPSTADDAEEPLPYRWAFVGLVGGAVAILAFARLAGMALWVAGIFFAIFFALSLAITRVRAEFGSPHEIYFVNPHDMMISFLGTRPYPPRSLTVLSLFYWFNRGYRNHPMPVQLEAFKMAEIRHLRYRGLLGALLVAILISIVATFWANLDLCYRDGAAVLGGFKDWVGWESFNRLQRWLISPTSPDPPRMLFTAVGSLLVLVMTAFRLRTVNFPFHPAGYALAVSFAMEYFWFAVFVSWALKLLILKQGGIRAYHRTIPLFLGLVVGDYFFGSLWAILGPLRGTTSYKIFI